MDILNLKLTEIKPYEKNPRRNDEATKYVAESIKNFGFKVPIVIDKNYTIVCGHTRYKAAKKLKLETVPCILADDLTEEQVKAFRLADNKVSEKAEWDFEILNSELKDLVNFDMGAFGFEEVLETPDEEYEKTEEDDFEVPEVEEPVSKPGDIYQLGNHRLMCGDSTKTEDVAKLMNGELADMVLTDPPYNVDYVGKTKDSLKIKNDSMGRESFTSFLTDAFTNLCDHLKEGGVYYIWHAPSEVLSFAEALTEVLLPIKQEIIWNKNTLVMGMQDYQWKHEPCFYGWKPGASHFFIRDRNKPTVIEIEQKPFDKMKKEELVKLLESVNSEDNPTSVIYENKPTKSRLHPTMKPIKLMARLIVNSSKKGEKVLDLFGGSGSTLIACEQLGRSCYMMEYDPKYADVIIQRWEEYTGQKAIKLN